jgi:hypothetical protein
LEKGGTLIELHFSTISVFKNVKDLDSYYPCSGVLSIINPYKVFVEGCWDGEGVVGDGIILGDASTRIIPLAELFETSVKFDKIIIDILNTASIRVDVGTASLVLSTKA